MAIYGNMWCLQVRIILTLKSLHCDTEQTIYERLLVKTKPLITNVCTEEHPDFWNNLDDLKNYTQFVVSARKFCNSNLSPAEPKVFILLKRKQLN